MVATAVARPRARDGRGGSKAANLGALAETFAVSVKYPPGKSFPRLSSTTLATCQSH
jgi:hypothetical protein